MTEPVFRAVFLHGKPASGKGTQGRILGAMPGFVHVSSGDLLRATAREGGEIGGKLQEIVDHGDLVPDEVMLALLERHLDELRSRACFDPANDLLVLDGIPRTVEQAGRLAQCVRVEQVIHLRCDDDELLLERVRRRAREQDRNDDRLGVFRKRLARFAERTAAVPDCYPRRARAEVDALRHPVLVHRAVLDILIARFIAPLPERHLRET